MDSYPEITKNILIKLAGQQACERGVDYFDNGHVEKLRIDGEQVLAEVVGAQDYKVQLVYNQRGLSGVCDCPASEGVDFCKHCVAAALALKTQLQSRKKKTGLKKSASPAAVIRSWLEQQDKSDIVEQFVSVVTHDRHLKREWLLKAEKGLGRMDKSAIKKQITAAMPLKKHLYEYPKVRAYFSTVFMVLQEIEQPMREVSADDQIALVDYAFERMLQALETVDDSGGFRYDSLEILQGLFVGAFRKLNWPDDKKAGYLLNLALTDEYYFHGQIPEDYNEVISKNCLELFYQKVESHWDDLPRLNSDRWEDRKPYCRLEKLLEEKAERAGDGAALIAIKEKVAVSDHNYVQLAELYFDQGDYIKAQAGLDKANSLSRFGRGQGHELQLKIFQQTGRGEEAVQAQWHYFQAHTSFENYQQLLKLAQQAQDTTDWTEQVIQWLQVNLENKTTTSRFYSYAHDKTNTLMAIYLDQKAWNDAWTLVESRSVSDDLQLALARQLSTVSLNKDWNRIIAIYKRQATDQVEKGNNEAYQIAIALLQELHGIVSTSEHIDEVAQLVTSLRVTYKRKRNFIGWLGEAFPVTV